MKRFSFRLGLGLLLLGACSTPQKEVDSRVETLPFYNEASFTPHWISPEAARKASFHQVAPFQLVNQDGDTLTEATFAGKIYVTDFFFTSCPGICPKMTRNMKVLQEEFREDKEVLLLSHSVTPKRDSVSVLKAYADNHAIVSGKWHLATGSQDEIYHLGRQEYFVEEDLGLLKEADAFLHTENFVLIDRNRYIRGIYNGLNRTSVQQLIADIRTLKGEH
ncbi:MAG: SCO family protein [Salibacteraceae bacterium]